jgi:hypothetical protein
MGTGTMGPTVGATPCAHYDRLPLVRKLEQSLSLLFAIVYEQWYHQCVIRPFIARGEINPFAQVCIVDGSVPDGDFGSSSWLRCFSLSGMSWVPASAVQVVHQDVPSYLKYRRSTFDEGREFGLFLGQCSMMFGVSID